MRSLTQQFTDWVREQPPEAEYNYSCNLCAFGSFLYSRGITSFTMYDDGWNEGDTGICYDKQHTFTPEFAIALRDGHQSFGALSERLSRLPTGRG